MPAAPSAPQHDEGWTLPWGATLTPGGSVEFRVWAPRVKRMSVQVLEDPVRIIAMQRNDDGIFSCRVPRVAEGADYYYLLEDLRQRPDPVSRCQPSGVHGPSRVVHPRSFAWTDVAWSGLPLSDLVFYEVHVGTFTPEGTFEAVIPKLAHLRDLGVNALELMPVASFPGDRNWGYDGVHLYAPQSSYGGPAGLKALVDACHRHGIAVVLDVVYNHLGPEGNYLPEFAPYLTSKYRTPWGEACNYDGSDSDGVRRHVIDNALYWLTEYHVDALRIDAVHGIFDFGAKHLLAEMREAFHAQAHALGRAAWLIAESDLNDVRIVRAADRGGFAMDAQWSDDFHHALIALVTGNRQGFFGDFGTIDDVRKALVEGFVYDGRRSRYRRRRHGSSSAAEHGHKFVVYIQNHDQVANASLGERLSTVTDPERHKLSACVLLCSPNLPLLFMGQEYGEVAPFHYFISHGDPALVEAVREGRRKEYSAFDHVRNFPDPQDRHTFDNCKLDWRRLTHQPHFGILQLYRDLIRIRRSHPALAGGDKSLLEVSTGDGWLALFRSAPGAPAVWLACNLSDEPRTIPGPPAVGALDLLIWSGAPQYAGPPGALPPPGTLPAPGDLALHPCSAAIYRQQTEPRA
jgi:maltooligosyltrehalose trehalohydrolase